MAFYSLLIVDKQESISGVSAPNRAVAVALFGQRLGLDLTLEDDGTTGVAGFLLDEWWDQPHWVDHTIPVFAKQP